MDWLNLVLLPPTNVGLFHFWALPYLCIIALGLGWAAYQDFRHLFEDDDEW